MAWLIHLLLHLFPRAAKRPFLRVIYVLWIALFTFGTLRFALAREWGFMAFTLLLVLLMLRNSSALWPASSPANATGSPSADRPDPIE